jgi:hypothetical protein
MKITIYFALLLTLILGGCEDKLQLSTNPETGNVEMIDLPSIDSTSIIGSTVNKIINGELGGEVIFDTTYAGGPHDSLKIYTSIVFPPNSFEGEKNITMTIQNNQAILIFEPSMIFNIPAVLNVTFDGLDLSEVNPSTVNFVYLNDDGSTKHVNRKDLKVVKGEGRIELQEAVIPHFSRLGFTR